MTFTTRWLPAPLLFPSLIGPLLTRVLVWHRQDFSLRGTGKDNLTAWLSRMLTDDHRRTKTVLATLEQYGDIWITGDAFAAIQNVPVSDVLFLYLCRRYKCNSMSILAKLVAKSIYFLPSSPGQSDDEHWTTKLKSRYSSMIRK